MQSDKVVKMTLRLVILNSRCDNRICPIAERKDYQKELDRCKLKPLQRCQTIRFEQQEMHETIHRQQ